MHHKTWKPMGFSALALAIVLMLTAGPAQAFTLWYNGDFDDSNGLADWIDMGGFGDAKVYDNFVVGGAGWNVESVWANNLIFDPAITTAFWEIRQGVGPGNPGTLVGGGSGAATLTATGRGGFGYTEYMVEMVGLNLSLAPGQYWLTVYPLIDPNNSASYTSTTVGANAVGTPAGNDGNSYFDSSYFGYSWTPTDQIFGYTPDFSMGVAGRDLGTVPEPATLTLVGVGLVGWMLRRRRTSSH